VKPSGNALIHSGAPTSRPLRTSAAHTILPPAVPGGTSASKRALKSAASITLASESACHSSWKPTTSDSSSLSTCAVQAIFKACTSALQPSASV
jgi:hypothetical protein